MKKYIYAIIILALAGTALAALLLVQHYYPASDIAAATCGDGLANPCHNLSLTGYADIGGFPLAALGLFSYLFIVFLLLVADYAGGAYTEIASLILLPIAAGAVVVDIGLAAILVATGNFCQLCVATYCVNILILAGILICIKEILRARGESFFVFLRGVPARITSGAGERASLALFSLFTVFLIFAILATTHIMGERTGKPKPTKAQVNEYIKKFYTTDIEQLDLPESPLVVGNPDARLSITVFTDFLCSACYSFHKSEEYLLARFPDAINFIYYSFPLDKNCNRIIRRTVYENSCVASKAISAASQTGLFNEYIKLHFRNYKEIKHGYSEETALSIFKKALSYSDRDIREEDFIKAMSSESVDTSIRNDIELANENDVHATPTIFIAGRRMRGAPPVEMLEAIVKIELNKQGLSMLK